MSTTVWAYVDTRKQVGDRNYLKVFTSADAAEIWFEENDPEGVAFEYEVIGTFAVKESEIGFRSPAPKAQPEEGGPSFLPVAGAVSHSRSQSFTNPRQT
jgi:hypothetical protein